MLRTLPAKPKKTSRKILLPLLCSFLMPGISLLNNVFTAGVDPRRVAGSWIIGFIDLLILWAVDQWIADRFKAARRPPALRLCVQILVNLILIPGFILLSGLLDNLRLDTHASATPAFIKLLLASFIILSVQATVASLAEKEDIQLANAELQNENLRTRFEALKQQVNPHFLFNALSTLRIMIREKDDRAEPFILKLSDLYRQLLSKNTAQTITLAEELEFLRSYIYMLQARFEAVLHIDIDTWPESGAKKIPAFSLQLLVENCTKHNIISSARPLYIRLFQQQENTILVENNLQLKPAAEESAGIGLDNLRKRYELLQVQNGVTINRTEKTFSVILKLLE